MAMEWATSRLAPTRVLADVAAKRRLVDLHMPIKDHGRFSEELQGPQDCNCCDEPHDVVCTTCRSYAGDHEDAPCQTLRLLALPYINYPDYQESWKPA
jgi:hypothetical protein